MPARPGFLLVNKTLTGAAGDKSVCTPPGSIYFMHLKQKRIIHSTLTPLPTSSFPWVSARHARPSPSLQGPSKAPAHRASPHPSPPHTRTPEAALRAVSGPRGPGCLPGSAGLCPDQPATVRRAPSQLFGADTQTPTCTTTESNATATVKVYLKLLVPGRCVRTTQVTQCP